MEERSLLSMSPDPLVVIHGGNWSEFIKKLRGVLGADLKLQESKAFCLKNSIDSLNGVLQNPRRNFRKKRSPRFDASLLDDDPSTSEVLSAALTLQLLREDNSFSPHFSGTGESKIGSEKRRKRCPGEDTEGNMRAVKKARRSLIPVLENLSPELPVNFKNRIRELTGSAEVGVVFVHEKTLFRTDVNPGQNRFLIPVKQVKNDFLTEKEKEILRTSDEISGKGSIEALLIQPSLDNCKINLRKWDMGGKSSGNVSENYVLVTTWNKVVRDNNMAEGMTVQLWSFRRGDDLCFALVNRG